MATKQQTLASFAELDQALMELAGSDKLSVNDKNEIAALGIEIVAAARRFKYNSTEGGAFDAASLAAREAAALARTAQSGSVRSLQDAASDAARLLGQTMVGAERRESPSSSSEREAECCRQDFDAKSAVLALSRDVARLTETIARLQGERSASSSLRSAPARRLHEEPGATADDPRVARILAAVAPDKRDRFSNIARQLVHAGNLTRTRIPSRPDLLTRIVGGDNVKPGGFLHCVCVGDPEQWMCTGALVSDRIVLTAAHCGPAVTRVMVGGNDVFQMEVGARVIEVSETAIHPAYRRAPYSENDISILTLAEPATQEPVSIANRDQIATAQGVRLVGFGYNDPQKPEGFGTKRHVQIDVQPIIRTSEDDGLQDLEEFLDFHGEYEFVTGRKGLGRDTCNGDSGGPAYIFVDREYRLAGLTSRATGEAVVNCGDGGIYVRPEHFREWIDERVNAAGAKPITWQ